MSRMIHCSVESCDSNLNSSLCKQISFFDFPQWEDSKRFLRWAEALGKPPEHFKEKDAFICSRHFRQEDLIPESLPENLVFEDIKFRLKLSESAVPSQYLCENDKSILKFNETTAETESPQIINYSVDVSFIKEEKTEEVCSEEGSLRIHCSSNKLNATEEDNNHKSTSPDVLQIINTEVKKEKPENLTHDKDSPLLIDIASEPEDSAEITYQHSQNAEYISSEEPVVKEYKCKQCGEKFAWINQLRKHKRQVHSTFRCNICCKLLANEGSLKLHKMSKHNISFIFSCQLCDEAFIKSKELLQHLRMHRSIEKQRCFKCKKKFATEAEIQSKKCLNCKKELRCEFCGKTFSGETILNLHKSKVHLKKKIDEKKKYGCDSGCKKFEKPYLVSLHKANHGKSFRC